MGDKNMYDEKLLAQGLKVCVKCGESLSIDMFYSSKTSKDGLSSFCKRCKKISATQKYYENKNNPECYEQMKKASRERQRKRYQEDEEYREKRKQRYRDDVEYREQKKAYALEKYKQNSENRENGISVYYSQKYQNNRSSIRASQKKYYEENKDTVAQQHKKYYDENKEKCLSRAKEYRQTEHGSAVVKACRKNYTLRKQNAEGDFSWLELEELLSFFDYRCAYTGEPLKEGYHLDHVVPLSKGGLNYIWNIVPSCPMANLSKNNKHMETWFKKQEYFSEERLKKIYEWISLKQKELKDLEDENNDDN